jgi:glycosyltransferase involved in cell wall biosynthesis
VAQVILELGRGGLETMSADLAIELAARGMRSVVVELDGPGEQRHRLLERGVEVVTLGGRRPRDPRFHWRLASSFRRLEADVIHTHMYAPLLYTVLARPTAGFPTVVHTEHSLEYLLENRHYRLMLPWMAAATRRFVVLGERMRRYYVETIGVARDRVSIVPNGVAILPAADAAARAEARAALGLSRRFVVGAVGRLAPEKNLSLLLAAFKQATRSGDDAALLIVGDGPEREKLVRETDALGISRSVRFVGWRDNVAKLLPALDVYALSSHAEGLPLAMLEAMSAGIAVVATTVGDIRDVVQDGVTGRLVPEGDASRFASALRDLRDDAELRRQLGIQARALVNARYSRSAMVDAYLDAYGIAVVPSDDALHVRQSAVGTDA